MPKLYDYSIYHRFTNEILFIAKIPRNSDYFDSFRKREAVLWAIKNKVSLSYADLSHADLSHVNLSGVNLSNASLYNVILFSANLSIADLSNTDFSYADLSYADLSAASLYRAQFCETKVENARYVEDRLKRHISSGFVRIKRYDWHVFELMDGSFKTYYSCK